LPPNSIGSTGSEWVAAADFEWMSGDNFGGSGLAARDLGTLNGTTGAGCGWFARTCRMVLDTAARLPRRTSTTDMRRIRWSARSASGAGASVPVLVGCCCAANETAPEWWSSSPERVSGESGLSGPPPVLETRGSGDSLLLFVLDVTPCFEFKPRMAGASGDDEGEEG
jgi:hypothetical protein